MSDRRKLLEVTYHSDDDTGMYQIGEIDFSTLDWRIEEYLQQFGMKGYKDIIHTLSYLSHEVHEKWFALQNKASGASCVKGEIE